MADIFQNRPLPNITTLGTRQNDWLALPSGGIGSWTGSSAALDNVYSNIHGTALPTQDVAAAGRYVESKLDAHNRIEFAFAFARNGGDPENLTANGRLWLLSSIAVGNDVVEYIGEYAGDLLITCGSQALATGSKLLHPSGYTCKWGDTITFTPDRTYNGAKITGSVGENGIAVLSIDSVGNRGHVLQLQCGSNVAGVLPLRRLV